MKLSGQALLIERNMELTESSIVTPENTSDKSYKITGIFMQSEVKNRNGRLYPEEYMDREANRYIAEKIMTHQGCGELNHPTGEGSLSMNYERVSHKIDSLTKSGTNWIGVATIAHKTPIGSTIAGLMECGIKMGVSSRATGSLKLGEQGIKIVQNDFKLITPADIVSDPSAPDAYMTSIMEGHEWVLENGALTEQAFYDVKNHINKHAKAICKNEEQLINVFQWIVNNKIGK